MPEPVSVARLEGLGGCQDSLIFRNHMPATAVNRRRQYLLPGLEIRNRNVAQGAYSWQVGSQKFHSLLAIGAAEVIFPGRQLVPDHAVAYHQTKISGYWQQLIFERAAIKHQGMTGGAKDGYKLVHYPAARAYVFVFRFLAQSHQIQTGNVNSGE